MDSRAFLGKGLKFPLQVDPKTGKLAMVSYDEDIQEAIGIILHTYQGERVMRPSFGSRVQDYIFETVNNSMQEAIAYDLQRQLILQEPRIRDVAVTCGDISQFDGSIQVEISYVVRSTNNRYNQVYPFYLGGGQAQTEEVEA